MHLLLTLASLASAAELSKRANTPESQPGYLKLDAYKYTGHSWSEAVPVREAWWQFPWGSPPNQGVVMPLVNSQTFYETTLQLGSNRQRVGILVDTGSSDLWVIGSDAAQCEAGTTGPLAEDAPPDTEPWVGVVTDPAALTQTADLSPAQETASWDEQPVPFDCSEFGTFDTKSSDTFRSNDSEFKIEYADTTQATGTWGIDTVRIGDTDVANMSIAVCNDTNSTVSVFGIGPRGLEMTNFDAYAYFTPPNRSAVYAYDNFPYKLKDLGLTHSTSYSVYLNDSTAGRASVLFGAVDHDKYTGLLSVFPIIQDSITTDPHQPFIQITLNSITVGSQNVWEPWKRTQVADGHGVAVLDTGTTETFLPQQVVTRIAEVLKMRWDGTDELYDMKCADAAGIYITFTFQGVDIPVPASNFLLPLVDESNAATGYCMLALEYDAYDDITLGDSFLRAVYMAVNFDTNQAALAPARFESNKEDIDLIYSWIPRAVPAPQWWATYANPSQSLTSVAAPTPFSWGNAKKTASASSSSVSPSSTSAHLVKRASDASSTFSSGAAKLCVVLAGISLALMM